ncbi:MAG: hypothetical protein V4480_02885 [Patescibacteria group bacterium]
MTERLRSEATAQDQPPSEEAAFEAFFTRHGAALYLENGRILRSDSPEATPNFKGLLRPDLDPQKIEAVHKAAEKLLGSLNPDTDELFIVSSDIPRAIETADIYRQIAHTLGFTVIRHEDRQVRDDFARDSAESEIRTLPSLGLRVENLLNLALFSPETTEEDINWSGVSSEAREKWRKARALIDQDSRANWGENFVAHADEIGKLYPDIARAKAAYVQGFQNLLRLAKFAKRKSETLAPGRKIKVLAFGHENYIRPFLSENFGDAGFDNVETIKVEVGEPVTIERRGVRKSLED